MQKILMAFVIVSMCSCTLFRKDSGDDEMQKMTESVLKHKEGIEIDFKPTPQQKVK